MGRGQVSRRLDTWFGVWSSEEAEGAVEAAATSSKIAFLS